MNDENALSVVFRTSQYAEAAALTAMLNDARIPAEMLGENQNTMVAGDGGEMFAIRIIVHSSYEKDAVALIEAYMQSIGAAPHEEKTETNTEADALLPCPNCAAVGLTLHAPCSGCGFEIRTAPDQEPPLVKEHAPGSRTFCPECRDPLTFPSGKCRACAEELEPLENGDRLCPSLAHVLYRDTVGGFVCKACRRVWVDVAA